MRLLFLNQFHHPDTAATAQLLGDLTAGLQANGHEVHVLCGAASYNASTTTGDHSDSGIHVHRVGGGSFRRGRLGGRMLDYLGFYRAAAKALPGIPQPDLTIALTTPPYIGRLAARLKRQSGVPWICWHMDAYPEALEALAGWRRNSFAYRRLESASTRLLQDADRVVVLGSCMRRLLVERHGLDPDRCPVIPNWAPGEAVTPQPFPEQPTVLYSGNLGRGHDLTILLEALVRLSPEDRPRVCFSGRGHQRETLEAQAREAGLDEVLFQDHVPLDQLSALLGSASAHFISQKPGTEGVLVPSKLYGSLAAGRAVLFHGPAHTEVGETVERAGAGWVLPPGDVQALAERLAAVRRHPEEVRVAGDRARAYHDEHGGRDRALAQWRTVLSSIKA